MFFGRECHSDRRRSDGQRLFDLVQCRTPWRCKLHSHRLYEKSQVHIGDFVSIGHNAVVHGAIIKDYALIGMGAVVLDNAVVGEGAIVAANALVLSNTVIEPNTIWAGVPAKFVKKVESEQAKEINQKIAHNYTTYASWFADPEGCKNISE